MRISGVFLFSGAEGDDPFNPGGHKVVDAIWNFGYRDEIRRLATNAINTVWEQPSRSARSADNRRPFAC
jgi:hypothetical protein